MLTIDECPACWHGRHQGDCSQCECEGPQPCSHRNGDDGDCGGPLIYRTSRSGLTSSWICQDHADDLERSLDAIEARFTRRSTTRTDAAAGAAPTARTRERVMARLTKIEKHESEIVDALSSHVGHEVTLTEDDGTNWADGSRWYDVAIDCLTCGHSITGFRQWQV